MRPRSPGLLARRGRLYLNSDAPKLALRDFEEAINLDPSSRSQAPMPTSAAAWPAQSLGMYREAVADASRALRLGEPTDDEPVQRRLGSTRKPPPR